MKTLLLSLFVAMGVLASTFAQAGQKFEKVWGQCQLTKLTVLKSKEYPKGSQPLNVMADFSVVRTMSVLDENTNHPIYYDQTIFQIYNLDKTCLAHKCINSQIAKTTDLSVPNAPQEIKLKVKANDENKLDLVISESNYTDWLKLTYDYAKGVGKVELRTKINDWGFSTIMNEHLIYEFANCNFQGPVSFNPTQN